MTDYKYPCKGCEERSVGCHSSCQKYLDARTAHRKLNIEESIKKREADEMDDYATRLSDRLARIYHKRR